MPIEPASSAVVWSKSSASLAIALVVASEQHDAEVEAGFDA